MQCDLSTPIPPWTAHLLLVLALLPAVCTGADFKTPGLTPEALSTSLQTAEAPLVVDLREPWEYKIGHIPGAINIPLEQLQQHLDEVRGDNGVLIYCINGKRTRQAEPVLLDAGISRLFHLEGAFYAWIQSGLQVEKKEPPAAP